jgi:hypothetical protein
MIEGSDLDAAYAPLSQAFMPANDQQPMTTKQSMSEKNMTHSLMQKPSLDTDEFHKQIEHKQKMMQAAKELQQQINIQPTIPVQKQTVYYPQPSYLDKLISKKKEVMRMVQISIVILFAMSLHHFMKFGLKRIAVVQQWSADRELFARGMYPVMILFILWNMRLWK